MFVCRIANLILQVQFLFVQGKSYLMIMIPIKVLIFIGVTSYHDVAPEQSFAMSFDGIVKCVVPRIQLEASLASEFLASTLESWSREGFHCFFVHTPR